MLGWVKEKIVLPLAPVSTILTQIEQVMWERIFKVYKKREKGPLFPTTGDLQYAKTTLTMVFFNKLTLSTLFYTFYV